jgi:predicted transcriptional regulator
MQTVDKVIDTIKEQSTQKDWQDTVSDAEKNSIEQGLSDLREGKTVAHSEVKKRYEKWL